MIKILKALFFGRQLAIDKLGAEYKKALNEINAAFEECIESTTKAFAEGYALKLHQLEQSHKACHAQMEQKRTLEIDRVWKVYTELSKLASHMPDKLLAERITNIADLLLPEAISKVGALEREREGGDVAPSRSH